MKSQDSISTTLIDSIQNSLIAVAEIGGNHLLALDEQVLDACRALQGNCIAIDVTDLDFKLYCHPGNWGIRLSRDPPAGEVDASISGRAMALFNLATQHDKVSTSIHEGVRFQGDVGLAQKMQHIIATLDIDWEEILSRRTGDVLAYQIHQRLRAAGKFLLQTADSLLQTSSEYLREEARLTPAQVEFERFQAQLGDLKHDVERAQARLQQILDKSGKRPC